MRKRPWGQKLPWVVVTGRTGRNDAQKAFDIHSEPEKVRERYGRNDLGQDLYDPGTGDFTGHNTTSAAHCLNLGSFVMAPADVVAALVRETASGRQ